MISFFRKFRQHLIVSGKLSAYLKYAIGEILLVVIGILIALQINSWNENRKERVEEQKILKALQSDFIFNKKELYQNIEETGQTVDRTQDIIEVFTNRSYVDRIAADSLVGEMINYSTFHPSDGTLGEVINSGRLKILKNDVLRDKLSNWNSLVLDVTEDEVYMRNFIDTYIEPLQLETTAYRKETAFERSGTHLFEDPKFENVVVRLNRMAQYQIRLYNSLDKEVDSILVLIESSQR